MLIYSLILSSIPNSEEITNPSVSKRRVLYTFYTKFKWKTTVLKWRERLLRSVGTPTSYLLLFPISYWPEDRNRKDLLTTPYQKNGIRRSELDGTLRTFVSGLLYVPIDGRYSVYLLLLSSVPFGCSKSISHVKGSGDGGTRSTLWLVSEDSWKDEQMVRQRW